MATFSTTTPLLASGTWASQIANTSSGVSITGTVYSDQAGTLSVNQSFDGQHFDVSQSVAVSAATGTPWSETLYAPYIQLQYTNGGSNQTVFRLYGDIRDPSGNFIGPLPPVTGGEWAVLKGTPAGGYVYLGTFDGTTGIDAAGFAAIAQNQSGKYVAFDVATGVVTMQTVTPSSSFQVASF